MRKVITVLCTCVLLFSCVCPVWADGLTDDDLYNMTWTKVYEEPLQTSTGNVQGICVTEQYIIMIENVADDSSVNDVVTAYYKNDRDAQGNPVERFSVAKRVNDREWEHGNGMTYNSKTGEIYVALYTNTISENRGCLYVMDPETLDYVRTIKVTDDFNILGIDYLPDSDQYLIQSNSEGSYRFQLLDSAFQLIQDLGAADITPGVNSQDLCVIEDYILNAPLSGGGQYANVYSISRAEKVTSLEVYLDETDLGTSTPFEIESFTQTSPGHVLMAGRLTSDDGSRKVSFYESELPIETEEERIAREAEEAKQAVISGTKGALTAFNTQLAEDTRLLAAAESGEAGTEVVVAAKDSGKKSHGSVFKTILIVFVSVILLGGGFLAYAVHVQRERERRRRIARRRRAAARRRERERMEQMEHEYEW